MRFFTVVGVFFYTTALLIIACTLIVFALNWLEVKEIAIFLSYIQFNPNSRLITGLSGVLLILMSVSFAQLILGKLQRERTIAFNNPTGQVTISLTAVEDLIKRVTSGISELKEIKPDVIAGKKGIEVNLRLVLRSETNIPDLTSRLQDLVKSKVQEILGIEEQVIVRIHVAKITSFEEKDKKKREPEREEHVIPFSGYGKV
jgi:uncharacterized alkaline shock family protein YloU